MVTSSEASTGHTCENNSPKTVTRDSATDANRQTEDRESDAYGREGVCCMVDLCRTGMTAAAAAVQMRSL